MIAEKAADLMRGRPPRARADEPAGRPVAIHQGSSR
jgi:hypothetical protein